MLTCVNVLDVLHRRGWGTLSDPSGHKLSPLCVSTGEPAIPDR